MLERISGWVNTLALAATVILSIPVLVLAAVIVVVTLTVRMLVGDEDHKL